MPLLVPLRAIFAIVASAAVAAMIAGLGLVGAVTVPDDEVFRFTRGTQFAAGEEARLRGHLAKAAKDERIAVIITGHTGTQGDEGANIALSEDRANVAAALAEEMGVTADNIHAGGAGGGSPLPKQDGMSDRAHQSTLARVEVTLQVRR